MVNEEKMPCDEGTWEKEKRQQMKDGEKNWSCKSQIGYHLLLDHRCDL